MDNLLINSTEAATTSSEVGTVISKEIAEAASEEAPVEEAVAADAVTDETASEGDAAVEGAIEEAVSEGEVAVDGAVEGETAIDGTVAEDAMAGEVTFDDGTVMPGIDEGMELGEGVSVDPGLGAESKDVKDPLLSSWLFVIGISAAVLAVSIVLGVLLARRKIKKGIELYED